MNKNILDCWATIFLCLCLLFFTPAGAYGLVNGQSPEADDERFDGVAAFSKTQWLYEDKDGKGGHNWFGAGVLIAPDVVLIAKHLLPQPIQQGKTQASNQYAVRFRRHAEGGLGNREGGSASYHHATVYSWILSPNTDLALGILSKPVEHIEPVRVLLDDDLDVSKRRCMLAGWGSESPWRGAKGPRKGLRVGGNTATRNGGFLRVDSYKVELREKADGSRAAYIVEKNAVPNMHDSGGSIFLLDDEDKPVLAGIISTYSGGMYLPQANTDEFPIEAAVKGGRELMKAIKENRLKERE
ncbi:MAG: trypsin-like serine protease [Phycisphaeraceae bacterium]